MKNLIESILTINCMQFFIFIFAFLAIYILEKIVDYNKHPNIFGVSFCIIIILSFVTIAILQMVLYEKIIFGN